MDSFAFDVPFYDFTNLSTDNENSESFFEVEHGTHNGVMINKEMDGEEQYFSVSPQHNRLRRSISVGNLHLDQTDIEFDTDNIVTDLKNLEISPVHKSIPNKGSKSALLFKVHAMSTRADTHNLTRARLSARETNITDDHKSHTSTNKYVSMAEAINLFQQKTPSRFHSQSKSHASRMLKANGPVSITVAKSPVLRTKLRTRSRSAMSQEEKEVKDLEEAKKHQVKAHPVNMKILNGPLPLKSTVVKKAATKLEPFNLTEVPAKKNTPSSTKLHPEFHARPINKHVFAPPQPIIKANLFTVPHTPKLMKRYTMQKPNESIMETKNKLLETTKLTLTKPVPFSFEQRDKNVMRKREQLREEMLKKEQQAREFHANPIPHRISAMAQCFKSNNLTLSTVRSLSQESVCKSDEKATDTYNFKARPATVLHTKPFVPKKEERTLTEITEFKLNTEHRAKERTEFDQRRKETEEKNLILIEQEIMHRTQREQEEVAKRRKEAEIKANPIRRYKEVKAVLSKKLTLPKSPNFHTGRSQNKEN